MTSSYTSDPFDFYAEYKKWHERFYHRPFNVTRAEWRDVWCKMPAYVPERKTDVQFDYDKEQEGDAQ